MDDKQEVMDQAALLAFVNKLIKEKNPDVSESDLPKVRSALLKELNDMINAKLVGWLSDKDKEALNGLFDKNASNKEIDDFFIKKIPFLQAKLASVMLDFRAAYLYPLGRKEETGSGGHISPAPIDTRN